MKGILAVIILALGTFPVLGQWKLIDDFQRLENGQIFADAIDIGWYQRSELEYSDLWVLADPIDTKNKGIFISTYDPFNTHGNIWLFKELPAEGIPPDSIGTLFFRILPTQRYAVSCFFGTSHLPLVTNPDTGMVEQPGAWNDFNVLFQSQGDGNLSIWHDDGYIEGDYPPLWEQDWYKIWIIVHNTFDEDQPSGYYTVSVQGPQNSSLVPLVTGDEILRTEFSFRRPPIDEHGAPQGLRWFIMAANGYYDNLGEDLFLVDDFYFSEGENLTDPLNQSQWGYPWVNAAKDIDTGDWLGWINAWHDPFFWLYATNNWIFMEEPSIDPTGAWAYFYK